MWSYPAIFPEEDDDGEDAGFDNDFDGDFGPPEPAVSHLRAMCDNCADVMLQFVDVEVEGPPVDEEDLFSAPQQNSEPCFEDLVQAYIVCICIYHQLHGFCC